MRVALLLLSLVGCNEIYGLDPTTVRLVDARPPCAAGSPFTATADVPIAGDYSIEAARFTRSRSVAYLSLCPTNVADPKPGCEIYTAPYSYDTEMFAGFTKVPKASDPQNRFYDAYPTTTPDNQHMLFGSDRSGGIRIYIATTQNGSYDNATVMPLPATDGMPANEPYIVGERALYFSLQIGGSVKLFRMEGTPPTFGTDMQQVRGTDIANNEEFAPVVRDDELEIFFASGREMQLDIYMATRGSRNDAFGTPVKVVSTTTSGIDWPVWISPEGCELYYINKDANNVATLRVTRR